jgi:hypothetical protein
MGIKQGFGSELERMIGLKLGLEREFLRREDFVKEKISAPRVGRESWETRLLQSRTAAPIGSKSCRA